MTSGWWQRTRDRRRERSLDRRADRLTELLDSAPERRDDTAVATQYRDLLLEALDADPARAASVFASFGPRLTAAEGRRVVTAADEPRLSAAVERGDVEALTVVTEVAVSVPLPALRDRAVTALLPQLAHAGDVARFVGFLSQLQRSGLLTPDRLEDSVRRYLVRYSFDHEPTAWTALWDAVPEHDVPASFEVAVFRGRGDQAAALASSPAQRTAALRLCRSSARVEDLEAGMALARRLGDDAALIEVRGRFAEAVLARGEPELALPHFVALERWDRVAELHEADGRWEDALRACPSDDHARAHRLVGRALRQVDDLVAAGQLEEAGGLASAAAGVSTGTSEDTTRARTALHGVRALGRERYRDELAAAGPDGHPAVLEAWSAFEERTGELTEAARLAARGGDRYRAHRLFRDAGRYGDAVAVLSDDTTDEGARARAEASAEGGDARGSAAALRQARAWDDAAREYERAGDPAAAAWCWQEALGADAGDSADYVRCAIGANQLSALVDACVVAVERSDRDSPARHHLEELLRTRESSLERTDVERARVALGLASGQARARFEELLPSLVARARDDVDARFSDAWGLDLGTTTCVAAIYDAVGGRVVVCPWRGRGHFPSTVAINALGEELVAVERDEELSAGLVGVLRRSKRLMGTRRAFRVRERRFRAEEVAARLIRHARQVVEDHLAAHVRERVTVLAARDHGIDVLGEWLDRAEREHSFRLTRARVVVTVPAFFHNNQKSATRDAGVIAGTEVLRLVHEPTAACVAVHRQRPVSEEVVVADLGAGTLDLSWVTAGDGLYEVQTVDGDTDLGGVDFDDAIMTYLEEQLAAREVTVSASARRRLEIAAERLKIQLSSQEVAQEVLPAFADGEPVTLELTRARFRELIAEPLARLTAVCDRFRGRLHATGSLGLVLVGGPFFSPVVREVAERALHLTSIGVSDPSLVVAQGAALIGARLTGALEDVILLDVTPLALGIRVVGEEQDGTFAELVPANHVIPVAREDTFSTNADNQDSVRVEVFHGGLADDAKVAEFVLDGIPPAPRGVPTITVRFEIDANCVLTVTARDTATGRSKAVSAADTTLLGPQDRSRMTRTFERRRHREERRHTIRTVLERVEIDLVDGDTLLREWRSRRDAYRVSTADPNPERAEALAEMYRSATDVESELFHLELSLRDLLPRARSLIEDTIGDEPAGEEEDRLHDQLTAAHGRHGELRATVSRWNSALVGSRVPDSDPLAAVVRRHDADDLRGAIEAWRRVEQHHAPSAAVRRVLDCHARIGDRDGYEALLAEHRHRLDIPTAGLDDPEGFLAAVAASIIDVVVGEDVLAGGFVRAPNVLLVAGSEDPSLAGGRVLLGGRTPVPTSAGPVPRQGAWRALSATVALDSPPLRTGYPNLLRIGERVVVASLHGRRRLVTAVVQHIRSPQDGHPPEFSVSLDHPVSTGVSLVFNTHGEVIGGVETTGAETNDVTIALATWHDLAALLVAGGHDPWGP